MNKKIRRINRKKKINDCWWKKIWR